MNEQPGLILFTSIGFKLYETLSPSATLFTAIVVFIFQIIVSKIWLTYFRFGPLEWIWRCLAYKELLPIKKVSYLIMVRDKFRNTLHFIPESL